ncbi:MAG: GNAT family N-acetyltransferase [Chitinophagaceae bacterium]|nr:GNAT family N-acetyltransferase [Chitinophagaceae bacterium]
MEIKKAETDSEIMKCWEVLFALRPHLIKENFIHDVRTTLNDNRQLMFIEENGIAVAASIFEWGFNLYRGKYIYIDDLTTLPQARKKGYASQLLDWIFQYAEKNEINQVHLDSGSNAGRYDAHRLYLNKGFNITSFHFATPVK